MGRGHNPVVRRRGFVDDGDGARNGGQRATPGGTGRAFGWWNGGDGGLQMRDHSDIYRAIENSSGELAGGSADWTVDTRRDVDGVERVGDRATSRLVIGVESVFHRGMGKGMFPVQIG